MAFLAIMTMATDCANEEGQAVCCMERSYIAFISYKHTPRDAALAKQVHTLIENYVIPRSLRKGSKKLGVVFRDEEELPISSDLTESICAALDVSRYLIVICSPEAKESPWVAREINYFLRNHDVRDVFVVLADGEPRDVFPFELTHVPDKSTGKYVEIEPLAMDVRADSITASLKKARIHIKKLYAGMLGCSYDSLVQREKTRRLKRLTALAALCVLLAGSFIGTLFVKNRELSRKNDELTAAIELALIRESELLAGRAEEALQSGDVAAALRYAVDALYSGDYKRPYYAPAERALFTAVDVFQEKDTTLLTKAVLRHQAPIEMMTCSLDGASVYTIDAYGTVSGFGASEGELLWSIKLREGENSFILDAEPQLWYEAESGILACYYDNVLTGLDALTGKTVWQTEFEYGVTSGLYFDEAGKKLAYIGAEYIPNLEDYRESYSDYNLTVFSIRDGSLMHKIPIVRMKGSDSARFDAYAGNRAGGMFADSENFVGALFKTESGVTELLLYTVSLADGSVSLVENEALGNGEDFRRFHYVGSDRALVLSDLSVADPQTRFFDNKLKLQCYDLKAGSLLWENLVETEKYIPSDSRFFIIPGSKGIVIAAMTNMFVADKDSGEILASAKLRADIINMQPLVDGLFSFALSDGYCAIGWRSRGDLCDSRLFSATIDLPDTSEMLLYNGGLIQVYFTGNVIDGFSTLPVKEGGGSAVYLSEDRCTAYVACALRNPVPPEPVPVKAEGAEVSDLGDFIDENPQGLALLGRAWLEGGRGLAVLDPEQHTLKVVRLEEGVSLDGMEFHLSGDGMSVLACAESGEICRIGMDGKVTGIAQSEKETLKVVGDTQFVDNAFRADAARLGADGRILTARSDGQKLTFWLDGAEETHVPLPDGVCWRIDDGLQIYAMLHTGENGLVVLSDYASGDGRKIENFAVYDLESRKWKLVPDAARGSETRLVAFSAKAAVFAVYDEDMNIRVYNGRTAQLVHCINTGLPLVSVREMGMLPDDRYMYVFTQDGQFIVYAVETGERVFRTVFSGVNGLSSFSVWSDRENDRLYVRVDTGALCIDARSWEQLFGVKDFRFYSAAQNEVYLFSRGTAGSVLKGIHVPTTTELIDIARDALQ